MHCQLGKNLSKPLTADPSELVAPCGMNCALCAAYLAKKNDVRSQGVKMPICAGCRPRGKQCAYLKKWCPNLRNQKVTFCFECADFPCKRPKTIDKRYRTRYQTSFIENLSFIKVNGMEKFLEVQKEKWKCPKCGGTVCLHNGICFNCELEKLKAKKRKFRREETDEPKP